MQKHCRGKVIESPPLIYLHQLLICVNSDTQTALLITKWLTCSPPPPEWIHGFDLVYECNTIQILKGPIRAEAITAISDLVAPGGEILVSCRSRNTGEGLNTFPVALDKDEIDGFQRSGLLETHFSAYNDNQNPPVPHFFAIYKRSTYKPSQK